MWAFDNVGLLKPTEFHYAENQDKPFTDKELAFFVKLEDILDQLRLSQLFGLIRYPGDDFSGSCEFTEGTANINLSPGDMSGYLPYCCCTCNASTEDHAHGTHVYTT
ncbi:hypothetical protein GMORB2_6258 [Geosmithia morbida]|uniref:Uncharacterized protein n=1 Tax=Geosmithia morbida TaxID=1094350 RepID=A0A9P5D275_9HYPO|nr:uncharacterized protein GMORB2_6258 [Geosmithia morbida]KAF4123557.1 hypothetical protein GMORB2_6258 [Geosmithia morbida]